MNESNSEAHAARGVFDALLEGCQIISPEYRYVYVNEALLAQTQRTREQLVGRTMSDCYPGIQHTEVYRRITACLASRTADRMLNEFTFPDGSRGAFELRFVPVPEGVCVLSLDATVSKRAADELTHAREEQRQTQKLEAVGRLAAGIAHDFNNLLSVLMTHGSLLRTQVPAPLREDVSEMLAATERGAALTRQLLSFARLRPVSLTTLSPANVVKGLASLVDRMLGDQQTLVLSLNANAGNIDADVTQLEQLLLNLAANARDAMSPTGTLTVTVEAVQLDARTAEPLGLKAGAHVRLTVKDDGEGMSDEVKAHAFEPFFTTKPLGRGTGLGLATVFEVVQSFRGAVQLDSKKGEGTSFTFHFPSSGVVEHDAKALRGSETVLVVESDPELRAVTTGVLSSAGYEILEAADASVAGAFANRHPGPIHLVVADATTTHAHPGLLPTLLATRPKMRTLVAAWPDQRVFDHTTLRLPFRPGALLSAARELLSAH